MCILLAQISVALTAQMHRFDWLRGIIWDDLQHMQYFCGPAKPVLYAAPARKNTVIINNSQKYISYKCGSSRWSTN